ncbi:MAG: hypothetical protein FJX06_18605 [Alphaproteobacteria bacterium]|nr:hypothetical protein [Alphaproteobacteria bacterium]
MKFEKPDLAALQSERDVEDKLLYPLLISEPPTGLGSDPSQIRAQKNLRKFTIGKGRDQKSYVPDYVILRGNLPLVVAEAKKPIENVLEAFREARLYAAELNSIHPSGLNPTTRVIASNGLRLVAGLHDQSQPVVDLTLEEIDPYSIGMAELIELCGTRALVARVIRTEGKEFSA